jgi:hypothetical protein
MITQYNPSIELKPGMFVTLDSHLRESFAGSPARITKVTSASVVVDIYKTTTNHKTKAVELDLPDIDHEVTRRKTSITWVCDTLEEAIHMYRASLDHVMDSIEKLAEMRENAINAALKP